jgi:hypothetical protein
MAVNNDQRADVDAGTGDSSNMAVEGVGYVDGSPT